jgi:Cu/Ag efflux protein CusF
MRILAAALLAALVCACSPPAEQAADSKAESMSEMNMEAAADGPIAGVGVITIVDADAGKITLNHEPIEAIGWDAMTMRFSAAEGVSLEGLAVGDRVAFELESADNPRTLVRVTKQ